MRFTIYFLLSFLNNREQKLEGKKGNESRIIYLHMKIEFLRRKIYILSTGRIENQPLSSLICAVINLSKARSCLHNYDYGVCGLLSAEAFYYCTICIHSTVPPAIMHNYTRLLQSAKGKGALDAINNISIRGQAL